MLARILVYLWHGRARAVFCGGMGKARIAAAPKLGIRLWIMMRDQIDYEEFCRRGRLRQSVGKPKRECLISTVVLRRSDRVN